MEGGIFQVGGWWGRDKKMRALSLWHPWASSDNHQRASGNLALGVRALNFQFYGYTVRKTTPEDAGLAQSWTFWNGGKGVSTAEIMSNLARSNFWLKQGAGCESFLVVKHRNCCDDPAHAEPLGFFQTEHVTRNQVRIHFQASPTASAKKILRGITKLMPLIEQALCLRGVRAIFFTSHSLTMVAFMENLGYSLQPEIDGGADGVVMAKRVSPQPSAISPLPSAADLDAVAAEDEIRERTR